MEQPEEKLEPIVHRCPFCHEGADAEDRVACQGCLARHHEACWRESGRCGSCGDTRALGSTELPPLTTESATRALVRQGYGAREVEGWVASLRDPQAAIAPPRQRGWGGPLLALTLTIAGGIGGLAMWHHVQTRQALIDDDRRLLERHRTNEEHVERDLAEQMAALANLAIDLKSAAGDATALQAKYEAQLVTVRKVEEQLERERVRRRQVEDRLGSRVRNWF